MTTYRASGTSPPPHRRLGDPRASTGTVIASSFDPRYSQHPRSTFDTLASARGQPTRFYDAQPIAKKIYADQGYAGGTMSKTEYAVRPRNNSLVVDDRGRPTNATLPPASPIRSRPVVNNVLPERPRSPLSKTRRPHEDADGYIYPASSSQRHNHQRHHSGDPDHLVVRDKDRRERGGYRAYRSGQPGYPARGPAIRPQDEDAYSYTGPREQFDRDFPSRPPARRESVSRRERPNSAVDFGDFRPPPPVKRDAGPPPSAMRHFDRLEKAEARRSSGRSGVVSENERDLDLPRRRHTTKGNVSLHQDREVAISPRTEAPDDHREARPRRDRVEDDNVYTSDRDHRDHHLGSAHHDRRHRKHRDHSPERVGSGEKAAVAGLGGAAAVGLASALHRDPRDRNNDDDQDPRHERRHRRRREKDLTDDESREETDLRLDRNRDRPEPAGERDSDEHRRVRLPDDAVEGDVPEEEASRRHRRRRKHREKEPNRSGYSSDSESDSEGQRYAEQNARQRDSDDVDRDVYDAELRRSNRERGEDRDVADYEAVGNAVAAGEGEDDRPRRVQLVEPPKERDPEVKPKSILKPARQVPFPEDPNPTREGVAPLKDAGKKGIPPGARWTKINRKLVNPAALELAHERFEERDDYVIVLRVLAREDIEKFAEMTREIREAREIEWQERQDRRRRRGERQGGKDFSDDEDEQPKLTIEAPPPPPPAIANMLPGQGMENRSAMDPAVMAGYNTQV